MKDPREIRYPEVIHIPTEKDYNMLREIMGGKDRFRDGATYYLISKDGTLDCGRSLNIESYDYGYGYGKIYEMEDLILPGQNLEPNYEIY